MLGSLHNIKKKKLREFQKKKKFDGYFFCSGLINYYTIRPNSSNQIISHKNSSLDSEVINLVFPLVKLISHSDYNKQFLQPLHIVWLLSLLKASNLVQASLMTWHIDLRGRHQLLSCVWELALVETLVKLFHCLVLGTRRNWPNMFCFLLHL